MNWGNRLLLVFVVFGGGIGYMVYRCTQMPEDLVSANYYKDELAYQHVIDGARRANALSGRVELSRTADGVRLQLPAEMRSRQVHGSVQFYCPYDAARDRDLPLSTDTGGIQDFSAGKILPGRYTVKVSWTAGGIGYFNEQPFIIP